MAGQDDRPKHVRRLEKLLKKHIPVAPEYSGIQYIHSSSPNLHAGNHLPSAEGGITRRRLELILVFSPPARVTTGNSTYTYMTIPLQIAPACTVTFQASVS